MARVKTLLKDGVSTSWIDKNGKFYEGVQMKFMI